MKEACKPNNLREERKRRREKMGDGAEERWRKVTRHPLSQEGRLRLSSTSVSVSSL